MNRGQVRIRPIDGPGSLVIRETGNLVEILRRERHPPLERGARHRVRLGRLASTLGRGTPRRIVVGGLGFGATVRGVLDVVGPDASVVVVEKVEAIANLVRGPMAHVTNGVLDDARVKLVMGDVRTVLANAAGEVNIILLDVDNGPHWASFRSNARLYSRAGLAELKRALFAGGVLAVWSGYRADSFLGHLRAAGFVPSVVPLQERGRVRARAYVGSS